MMEGCGGGAGEGGGEVGNVVVGVAWFGGES